MFQQFNNIVQKGQNSFVTELRRALKSRSYNKEGDIVLINKIEQGIEGKTLDEHVEENNLVIFSLLICN